MVGIAVLKNFLHSLILGSVAVLERSRPQFGLKSKQFNLKLQLIQKDSKKVSLGNIQVLKTFAFYEDPPGILQAI